MIQFRWLLAPVAAGLLGLIVACGGDKDSGPNSVKGDGSSGRGSNVSTELNLSNAANRLMELRSFRFDVALKMDFDADALGSDDEDDFGADFANAFLAMFKDIKMEGAYVAPDSFDLKMGLAGEEVHMIQVGDRAWINEGSGWKASGADSSDLSFLGNPSSLALDLLPNEVLNNAKTKSEKVNGVDTTRYSFDKKALEAIAGDLGEETAGLEKIDSAKLDVWMTDENIPVKIAMEIKGKAEDGSDLAINLEFNVTDLNSDKIEIKAPI
jgi:hypothetical protein